MKGKVGVFCGLVVVVVALAWNMLVFAPKGRALAEAEKKAEAAQSQTAELDRTVKALEAVEKEGPATRAKLEKLQSSLPKDADLDGFIVAANGIAQESGIEWVSVVPTPPAANAVGTGEIKFTVQLRGGFFQILDYMRRLERLDRVVVVDGLELSAEGSETDGSGAGGQGPALAATIQARMFTLTPPTPIPGTAAAAATTTTTTTAPAGGES